MAKLLLIEDEQALRENTCDLLEAFGFECIVAGDGMEGLKLLHNVKLDLIICDIMMPGMDGYQIKQEINKNPKLMNIPFIFLSGKTAGHDINYGLALGALAFISKPYKIKNLVRVINEVIG